ncbi:MAG TPA: dipeptide/oligopeptide/nickel ABC transporter ATP-binding protein [Opitutaceae bacterium]|jgi:peptide/nickel transport system ATP-binding protein|nr:ABC transporter ATP-binding protein [Opitutaceae bacterium]HRE08274.1 dipeptide/oligopeptide/nickel ABC transporter ATP-binding protein [Opitutaceae bacterium]
MPSDSLCFEANHLSRAFGHGRRRRLAVNDATFTIREREIVSLVGQSGCGKTVLAKMLLRLEKPTSGQLLFRGRPIDAAADPREHWRQVQAVFQDPYAAFNQFFSIRSQLKAAFHLFPQRPSEREMEERVDQALLAVNIRPPDIEGKYPFELSGGQMQRMLLARIFILRPQVLIADEPTSMVDACSRAGILEYLMKLKEELQMTIVFVTHDIGLAYYVSDRIFILHEGQIVEQGTPDAVTQSPTSPVTRQLLDDIPSLHREWIGRAPRA